MAAVIGVATFSPQASKAATPVEDLLKVARTVDDSFELYITYDKDQTPLDSSSGVNSPALSNPYTFTGYTILSVRGTYTNPDGETYDIVASVPTPAGSVQRNPSPVGTPSGINDLAGFPTVPTIYRSYWPFDDPNNKYPDDLIPHNVTDNLYNPSGGFAAGDLPVGRTNGVVSFGGFQFFVDYGPDYASEQYPNRYLPYQFFFKDLAENDPNGFDYAGCPGSCAGAKIVVPGPLPLLGVGAAFGFSRRLRKRIKGSKASEVISTIG